MAGLNAGLFDLLLKGLCLAAGNDSGEPRMLASGVNGIPAWARASRDTSSISRAKPSNAGSTAEEGGGDLGGDPRLSRDIYRGMRGGGMILICTVEFGRDDDAEE